MIFISNPQFMDIFSIYYFIKNIINSYSKKLNIKTVLKLILYNKVF